MSRKFVRTYLVSLLFCLLILSIYSTRAATSESELIEPTQINEIINRLKVLLKENYVFEDVGIKYSDGLNKIESTNKLFTASHAMLLQKQLSEIVNNIYPDGHLRVFAPALTQQLSNSSNFTEPSINKKEKEEFISIESNDNYVHLIIHSFPDGDIYYKEVVDVLSSISPQKSIIVDLRDNLGGSAKTARIFMNCFLSKDTPLFGKSVRVGPDKGEHKFYANSSGSCKKTVRNQLAILVNKNSASGAELLTLILKNRSRAIIIGQKTYGAGHPVELYNLPYGFSVLIPISTIYDLVSGENFELKGVVPNVETPIGQELTTAISILIRE